MLLQSLSPVKRENKVVLNHDNTHYAKLTDNITATAKLKKKKSHTFGLKLMYYIIQSIFFGTFVMSNSKFLC